MARLRLAALVVVGLLAGCAVPGTPEGERSRPVPSPVELRLAGERGGSGVVLAGGPAAPYNYAPSVLSVDGGFRAWWCSQLPGVGPAGDDILSATGSAPDAFGSAVPVFSGRPGAFDAMHTCDPSVLRVDGRYRMYYTGAAGEHDHGNAIGVATSDDGLAWTRAAEPVVTVSGGRHRANTYGAGQPSALHLDGWYYLMFTDTTARGAGWNGAGQFVIRSRDAEFRSGVQELTSRGFVPERRQRSRSVVDAFSADWAWSPALNAFAIAHQTAQGTRITFWDRGFTRHPYEPVTIPGPWREGPGLVRDPSGHVPVDETDPCGAVALDVLRATTLAAAPTDIRHYGVDAVDVGACAGPQRAARTLQGFAVPNPVRTVDIITGGARLRVERRSVAAAMAVSVLDSRPSSVDELPVAAEIPSGAVALRSPSGELGLLDSDGGLWKVPEAVVAANGSRITDVGAQRWRRHLDGDR
ncbi:beta-xylosidase [Saccharopolyspora halophila]|uniref:beta-xylosidase n=1 Tax=Saccharopolyspora halophila TaxID=405551 RepID=UPI0031DC94F5